MQRRTRKFISSGFLTMLSVLGLWSGSGASAQSTLGNKEVARETQDQHPLARQDDKRSIIAGAKMERIQSFDKPISQNKGTGADEVGEARLPGSKSDPSSEIGGSAEAKNVAPRAARAPQKFSTEERAAPSENLSWQKGSQLPARVYKNIPMNSVYLNGENIVGLRNQLLEGVNIRFDAQGNIFIDAPQYEVHHDSSYHPLLPDETPQYSKGVESSLGSKLRSAQGASTK